MFNAYNSTYALNKCQLKLLNSSKSNEQGAKIDYLLFKNSFLQVA